MTTGRSVDDAVESALDQLGVDHDDAEIEVLEEPRRGILRRVRSEARVRVRVRPSIPPRKLDRRDRRRRDGDGRGGRRTGRGRGKGDGRGGKTGAGANGTERVPAGVKAGAGGRARDGGRGKSGSGAKNGGRAKAAPVAAEDQAAPSTDGRDAAAASAPPGEGGAEQGESSRSRRRRRSRQRRKAEGAREVSDSTATATEDAPVDLMGQRAAVEEFVQGLVTAFGREDATVTTSVADDTVEVSVDGPELGLLVGQKGVTLQALQELARSVIQRRFVGQGQARIRVDVAGYRERRREALERFAIEVAESVRTAGVPKALDPMNAADRKVVHDAVNALDDVETMSEGEGDARHVVIQPSG